MVDPEAGSGRLPANQIFVHRFHGHPRMLVVPHARKNRPALCYRINPAFRALSRADRGAVIKVSPAVPFPIPAMLLDTPAQPFNLALAFFAKVQSPRSCAIRENRISTSHMKNANHTLSPLPSCPTMFIPSFQSPEPMRGRPCSPNLKPLRWRAHNVHKGLLFLRIAREDHSRNPPWD
jgi:hypothetical protein